MTDKTKELISTLDSLEIQIKQMSIEISTSNSDKAELEDKLIKAEASLIELNSILLENNEFIDNQYIAIDVYKSQINDLKQEKAELDLNIESLIKTLNDRNIDLQSKTHQITELNLNVSHLNTKMEEAYIKCDEYVNWYMDSQV